MTQTSEAHLRVDLALVGAAILVEAAVRYLCGAKKDSPALTIGTDHTRRKDQERVVTGPAGSWVLAE